MLIGSLYVSVRDQEDCLRRGMNVGRDECTIGI